MPDSEREVTRLLNQFREGDRAAGNELAELLQGELRQIAARAVRRHQAGDTWQPTALINEAYVRLVGRSQPEWQSRAHFFGVAATIMRNILVDQARSRLSAKRGAGAKAVALDDGMQLSSEQPQTVVAVDDALGALAKVDERRAKVLELRFFAGLNIEEAAEALGISPATVKREMKLAEAWLARELSGGAKKSFEAVS